jgi:hypothetical protein
MTIGEDSRQAPARAKIWVASATLLWSVSAGADPAEAPSAKPAETPGAADVKESPASKPAETPAAPAPAPEPLPDPATWHQDPPPVLEKPRPMAHVPKLELGFDAGVVSRPSEGDLVHYGLGWAVGPHVRVDILRALAARVQARFEGNSVSFDDGALGLPRGTRYQSPDFRRVSLGIAAEPTWTPLARLDLWIGLGVGWGRTTVGPLQTSGAESVELPIRSAVFVEFPFSLGVRYQILPRHLVVNVSGSASFLSNQSGRLEDDHDTPGASGRLVTVRGFPTLGTSFAALAGIGVLL